MRFVYKHDSLPYSMTRWAKDATKFTVSVTRNVTARTNYSYIPRPVLRLLGDPKHLTFEIEDGKVTVKAGHK